MIDFKKKNTARAFLRKYGGIRIRYSGIFRYSGIRENLPLILVGIYFPSDNMPQIILTHEDQDLFNGGYFYDAQCFDSHAGWLYESSVFINNTDLYYSNKIMMSPASDATLETIKKIYNGKQPRY